jgi:hypothetical protein
VDWKRGEELELELHVPDGISAVVELPVEAGEFEVLVDDQSVEIVRQGTHLRLSLPLQGHSHIRVRGK